MRLMKIVTLAVAAASATGCQSGGLGPSRSAAPTTAASVQQEQSPAAPSDSAAPRPAATDEATDKVLASREGTVSDAKIRVDVVQLLRREQFVTLTFTATVLQDRESLGWQVHSAFSALPQQNPTVDGVFLVDVKNAKKHLVALDSEGRCVCSRIQGLFLRKDQTAVFSATFAAPPADVAAVDVHIPNVGTLADVPIS